MQFSKVNFFNRTHFLVLFTKEKDKAFKFQFSTFTNVLKKTKAFVKINIFNFHNIFIFYHSKLK